MTAPTTIDRESLAQEGFYVPRFEVRVRGVGLPQDVIRDVISLTYKDNIREIDSFEIAVANWDPVTFDYKYLGARAETRAVLDNRSSPASQLLHLFEPCNHEVEVQLGYAGKLRTMVKGNFTTMEPSFSNSGPPTLTVRGLNVLHQLRRRQYTTAFAGKKPSQIARDLSRLRDRNQPRFPLTVRINDTALSEEEEITIVTQKNQYDIDFLFTLARRFGYVVFVEEANAKQGTPRRLYFGPSSPNQAGVRDVTFKLERGKSIIDFKPTLTTANQVKSVTVNGYNRVSGREISETVTLDELRNRRNEDLYDLIQRCDPREEFVVDRPVFTRREARRVAEGMLRERQTEMVKATVTTIGLPDLVSGKNVIIEGYGARLDGKYFITDSTHTYNDSGYTTQITCRRENDRQSGGAGR